jgi:hypothetical protein
MLVRLELPDWIGEQGAVLSILATADSVELLTIPARNGTTP